MDNAGAFGIPVSRAKAYVAYAQACPGMYGLMFRTERLDMSRAFAASMTAVAAAKDGTAALHDLRTGKVRHFRHPGTSLFTCEVSDDGRILVTATCRAEDRRKRTNADGGLWSSAADLSRWLRVLLAEGRWEGEATRSAYLFFHSDAAPDFVSIDAFCAGVAMQLVFTPADAQDVEAFRVGGSRVDEQQVLANRS